MHLLTGLGWLLAATIAPSELPRGVVIPSVVCAKAPAFSYALYLPKSLPADKPVPLLLLFDPGGDGLGAVKRFEEAAEATGTAVAGSLDSHNGMPWGGYTAILTAFWEDLGARFPDGPRYVGGFSGGARIALGLTLMHPGEIRGLFSAGAFYDVGTEPPAKGVIVYMVCGDGDFNLPELRRAANQLTHLGVQHRREMFAGGHQWPPAAKCLEGLAYLRR